MALTTRVWSAGKLLLLGVALVLTYVVFAAASMRIAIRTREVMVPTLTGTIRESGDSRARRVWPDAEGRRDAGGRIRRFRRARS